MSFSRQVSVRCGSILVDAVVFHATISAERRPFDRAKIKALHDTFELHAIQKKDSGQLA
jgi:hypothetical protein